MQGPGMEGDPPSMKKGIWSSEKGSARGGRPVHLRSLSPKIEIENQERRELKRREGGEWVWWEAGGGRVQVGGS